MNFNDFFKGMDQKKLEESIKKATEFAKTKQGQDIINSIKGKNSNAATPANLSDAEKENLLKQVTSNPELMRKLEDFLK